MTTLASETPSQYDSKGALNCSRVVNACLDKRLNTDHAIDAVLLALIRPRPTIKRVFFAVVADEDVVIGLAIHLVVTGSAHQRIIAESPRQSVVARTSLERVVGEIQRIF